MFDIHAYFYSNDDDLAHTSLYIDAISLNSISCLNARDDVHVPPGWAQVIEDDTHYKSDTKWVNELMRLASVQHYR